MYSNINKYLFVFTGWLIRISYQLECVQCTTPVLRVSQNWDHLCLDGTLTPLPCQESINRTILPIRQCASSVYRLSRRKNAGVVIHRGCSPMHGNYHECDPPNSTVTLDTITDYYCIRTCTYDGCNRHSAKEIISNANELFKSKFILLYFISIIFLFYFKSNLFS